MKHIKAKIILLLILSVFIYPLFGANKIHPDHPHHSKHKRWEGKKGKHQKMPSFDKQAMLKVDIQNEQSKGGAIRFAEKFYVDFTPANSGETIRNEDGSLLWKIDIQSDSAYSINLLFSKFNLLEGDTVYVYNTDKTKIVGPLTQKNNLKSGKLPTVPIEGDAIIVELRQSADTSSLRALEIGQVNHDYRGFRGLPQLLGSTVDDCSYHASCYDATNKIEKAVCLLIIDGAELCTGTLLNNTAQDKKPYVLTAAHCFSSTDSATAYNMAPSVVAFFNYEAPNCTPSVRGSVEFSIGGSTMRAYAADIDMALIELSAIPPVDYQPYYAGWNTATSPSPPFHGVHHPFGTVKRVCVENNAITNYTLTISGVSILPNSHWRVARWDYGTTDNGSSGSGLFDASGKLVGALTAGSSFCNSPVNDYYYRFNKAWNTYPADPSKCLKPWLDPISLTVDSFDGFNPYGNDSAARVSNIAKGETVEKAYLGTGTGLISGQNSLAGIEYAEKFSLEENAYLYGVYIMPPIANANTSGTSPNEITIKVYASKIRPSNDSLIDYITIDLKTLQWNSSNNFYSNSKVALKSNENYVRFPSPIAVGKDFFISYDVPYTNLPTDSFSVFSAVDRATGALESAYVSQAGVWSSMYDFAGVRTSLWIDPLVVYDPTAIYTDTFVVDINKTVVYPNPAKDFVIIDARRTQTEFCTVTIYNYLGQMIKKLEGKLTQHRFTIGLEDLSSGLYFLRIDYAESSETHKIIIQK